MPTPLSQVAHKLLLESQTPWVQNVGYDQAATLE